MSTPVALGLFPDDARVWSCHTCAQPYGNEHDPFTRCAYCGECGYGLVTVAVARLRLQQKRNAA